ncbi:hypothetical protein BGZ60DRAFT_414141, partial [Tricladium varicosporioides]
MCNSYKFSGHPFPPMSCTAPVPRLHASSREFSHMIVRKLAPILPNSRSMAATFSNSPSSTNSRAHVYPSELWACLGRL